jgi:hypothetical protein
LETALRRATCSETQEKEQTHQSFHFETTPTKKITGNEKRTPKKTGSMSRTPNKNRFLFFFPTFCANFAPFSQRGAARLRSYPMNLGR